jgi:hypothetical protein
MKPPEQPENWSDSAAGQRELFYNVCAVYINIKLSEEEKPANIFKKTQMVSR